ncbi:MAG: hypothetical protein KAT48_14330 [Bacteroidales bacterium]|nr:hypothetical protein [Bacteroidales bacterium]
MKQTLTLIMIVISLSVTGQNLADTISIEHSRFYQNGKMLNMKQLVQAVKSNQQAYKKMHSAQGNRTLASILSFPGGFLIGYPVGTAIGGGEPNWVLACVGAGLIAIAIPITITAKKQATEGVKLYNSSLSNEAFLYKKQKPEFTLGVTQNGLGLVMMF